LKEKDEEIGKLLEIIKVLIKNIFLFLNHEIYT